jgi:hypothetical protein
MALVASTLVVAAKGEKSDAGGDSPRMKRCIQTGMAGKGSNQNGTKVGAATARQWCIDHGFNN